MNEQTAKLLEQLAQKLGTTAEYLWIVLLKQAHISATTILIQLLIIWVAGILLFRLHIKFSKEPEDGGNTLYYEYGEGATIPMLIGFALWAVFFLISFFFIPDVVNGYFNPEYWALNKVLETVK